MRKVLHAFGSFLLIVIIVLSLPFVIPKMMGYEVLEVTSGSMEPEYPVGCLVYVEACDYKEINEGDVISFKAYNDSESLVTHRVIEKNADSMELRTQGDANDSLDPNAVPYSNVVGKVVYSINGLGLIVSLYASVLGRVGLVFIILIIFLILIATDEGKKKEESKKDEGSSKKKANQKLTTLVCLLLGIVLVVFAASNLIKQRIDYNSSNNAYAQIAEKYVNTPINTEATSESEAVSWIEVDFDSLCEINPEIIGWIYFENEEISYPIMFSADNEKYLRTTFEGSAATAGSIFMEAANNPVFSDQHTIIYGHNMRNLSMFGRLKKYNRDPDYYKDHKYFQIVTKDNRYYRYEIFAYETVNEDAFIYDISFDENNSFMDFVNKIYKVSEVDTGIFLTESDKIVSLSTCSTSGEENRFVVNAVLCEEK